MSDRSTYHNVKLFFYGIFATISLTKQSFSIPLFLPTSQGLQQDGGRVQGGERDGGVSDFTLSVSGVYIVLVSLFSA